MRDILLIGGMGAGKSTLADAILEEDPSINYIHASRFATRIPMTLIRRGYTNLTKLSKAKYIQTILENRDLEVDTISRLEMDKFVDQIAHYGKTVTAETYYLARDPDRQNLIDNTLTYACVEYLKERGLYVVGLKCSFENQVKRRFEDSKDIDPKERKVLEEQVKYTNEFGEISKIIKLADFWINTDFISEKGYPFLAKEILKYTQQ